MIDFKTLIGYKDKETLETETYNEYRANGGRVTNFNKFGAFRRLVSACLQGAADLWDLLLNVVPNGFAMYAKGQWLRAKCADMDIQELEVKKTEGNIIFGRNSTSGNVNIPAASVVKTKVLPNGKTLKYISVNTSSLVLTQGNAEINVLVRAEFPGSEYNVGENTITEMVTYVSGIDYVRNAEDWITIEGTDPETDEALQERYQLKWSELAQGGIDASYISWARSIAGVRSATVDSDHPRGQGTVDVTIASNNGMPSAALITEVQNYINTKRPNIADVLVKGPNEVAVDITITLVIPTDQGDLTEVQAEGEARYNALFAYNEAYKDIQALKPLQISESLYLARLISIGMGISPVLNVVITSPAADVVAANGDLLVHGTITITAQRVA